MTIRKARAHEVVARTWWFTKTTTGGGTRQVTRMHEQSVGGKAVDHGHGHFLVRLAPSCHHTRFGSREPSGDGPPQVRHSGSNAAGSPRPVSNALDRGPRPQVWKATCPCYGTVKSIMGAGRVSDFASTFAFSVA
jgi:hypothetical protein